MAQVNDTDPTKIRNYLAVLKYNGTSWILWPALMRAEDTRGG